MTRLRPLAGSRDITADASALEFVGAQVFGRQAATDLLLKRIAIHEASHCVACLSLGLGIIHVTIAAEVPHLRRGTYKPPPGIDGLQCMCIVALSGPCGEECYVGKIDDDSDRTDIAMAHDYLTRAGCSPLWIGAEVERLTDAARRLVTSPFARQRIPLIAEALLKRGSLTGEQVSELSC